MKYTMNNALPGNSTKKGDAMYLFLTSIPCKKLKNLVVKQSGIKRRIRKKAFQNATLNRDLQLLLTRKYFTLGMVVNSFLVLRDGDGTASGLHSKILSAKQTSLQVT